MGRCKKVLSRRSLLLRRQASKRSSRGEAPVSSSAAVGAIGCVLCGFVRILEWWLMPGFWESLWFGWW